MTSTPGEAAALAASPIFSVIERVVFGLMTWMCMARPPGVGDGIEAPDARVNCLANHGAPQAPGLRVTQAPPKA